VASPVSTHESTAGKNGHTLKCFSVSGLYKTEHIFILHVVVISALLCFSALALGSPFSIYNLLSESSKHFCS
jgi:hypothetical protein